MNPDLNILADEWDFFFTEGSIGLILSPTNGDGWILVQVIPRRTADYPWVLWKRKKSPQGQPYREQGKQDA